MKQRRFPPSPLPRSAASGLQSAICILSLSLLSIPVLQPLLGGDLTCGFDNVLHLWRAIETDALLEHGIFYSRWQPHMALGFGYPALLFHPPISPLLAALFHRLGLPWLAAVNATFVTGTLLSGWSVWLLVREWWGDMSGVVAGVIIVTLPFHAYVNFRRASMSEAVAWALPALILWGLIRWQKRGQRRGLLVAAGAEAALLLTHDASAYLFLPLSLAAIVALALAHRSGRMLGRGILALALGAGLAAFFWLPSVMERSFVQFGRVLEYPYAASFVAVDYLLEPPRASDPSWINPWLPKGIGLIPVSLAVLSPLAWSRASREQRFWLAAIGLGTLGYVGLALPYARPIWRLIPVLQYLHFPWRFLTPAAVGVAVLGGVGAWTLRRRAFVAPLVAGGLVLASLGWLYPPHCRLPQPTTLPGMLAYEQATGDLGSTFLGELLPASVRTMPAALTVGEDLDAGREAVRLRPESLPEGSRLLRADYGPVDATIEIESPVPFRARYLAFYYPGWRVSVDGTRVPIAPTEPDGLIAFDVPAGRHTVRVQFGETAARLAADVFSLLSLVALFLLMVIPGESPQQVRHPASRTTDSAWPLLLVSILLLVTKVALIDRFNTPLRRVNLVDGRLRNVDVPAEITFGDELVLLGTDALPESVPSGERFEFRTYWRALHPGGPDYGVTINVVDAQGQRWNGADIRPPRWHSTPPPAWEWSPDQYALVALSVPLKPGAPPGTYTFEVVAFDRGTLAPLTAHDANGQAIGPSLPLGQITVSAPRYPVDPDAVDLRRRLDLPLGPLTLLGAHFDRIEAAPGHSVLLTVHWRAEEQPLEDLSLHMTLVSPNEDPVAEYDLPPVAAWHPTTAWRAGDLWRGQHSLRLPAHLESGAHRWTLQVCPSRGGECQPGGAGASLDQLQVNAPEHQWAAPPLDVVANVRLDDAVTLLGATLDPQSGILRPGKPLTVTLAWHAEAEMAESFRVFLHLLGPHGALVVQSDGEPANWTRPTTGWLTGEVVQDERVLAIPRAAEAGEYRLLAGMYTLEGGRLTTPDGSDAVMLTTVLVGADE